jgi:serine/threonine protein kinase
MQDQGGSSAEKHDEEQKQMDKPKEERVGTPLYLAPELWKYAKCSKKSDIWALGVMLYELCCLYYPYNANNEDELMQKVLNEKPTKFPNHVSIQFQEMILKMLKRDPAKRPCIEEIIYSDTFQAKAQQNLITLPLNLNKSKLTHKYNLNQLDQLEVKLTDT